jgi:PAS domain S-box-containing protein
LTPPAGRPLLWHLALLGLTLTLPVLLFAAVVAASFVKAERQRLTAELVASARQTAAVLDLQLAGYGAAVHALATSTAATEGLRQQGERVGRQLGLHFVLHDALGEEVFDTRRPQGSQGRHLRPASETAGVGNGEPQVSDLVPDELGLQRAVLVTAPLPRVGAVSHFLSAVVDPARLREPLLNRVTAPEGSTLVDGTGTIIARWRQHEAFVGKPMPPEARAALVGDEGFMEGRNLEGERNVVAYTRLRRAGWYVGAGMLAETLEAPLRRSLAMLASLALGLAALAGAGSFRVARRLARPIDALARSAEHVGHSESVAAPVTPVREVNVVARALADASEQLQAHERELRASNERFRALAEGMPHFVWETDANGEATYENARWREYTGLDHDDTGHGGWLRVQHPDDAPRMAQTWAQAVATGGEYDTLCRFRRAADGAYRWFRVKGAPIRDDAGCIARWVGTCTDVQEQRVAEEALREADRRKDEFLAMLGHELRNPLAPVANAVRILGTPGAEPVARERAREMIERQVIHMGRLIDDLLDVSRITRGTLELRRAPVALAPLVAEAVEAVRAQCEAAGLQLEASVPEAPVVLDADRVRLAQVLGNLLTNACRYTGRGGTVRLAVEVAGDWAEIRVADTGVGIPRDRLAQVFEPFTQLDRSQVGAEGGLGLGLALVRELVALHGGAVTAASEGLGRGSEFVVRLPLAAAVLPLSQPPAPPSAPVASRHVLVVDDNRDNADSLTMLLALAGHDARAVYDGAAAIAAAGAQRAEVVLLDLGMPKMDGFEVCRRLRGEPWGSAVTVIALSGWGHEADRRKARDAGFDGHLVKPVDFDALLQAIAGARRGGRA